MAAPRAILRRPVSAASATAAALLLLLLLSVSPSSLPRCDAFVASPPAPAPSSAALSAVNGDTAGGGGGGSAGGVDGGAVNGDASVNGAGGGGGGGGSGGDGFNLYGASSGFESSPPPDLRSGYDASSPYSRSLIGNRRRSERRTRRREVVNKTLNRERNREMSELGEDGYGQMFRRTRSIPIKVFRAAMRGARGAVFPSYARQPGTLILVRHGESLWNANKTFTGWADPDLSAQGYREVEHAARLLLEGGYKIDVVFTSRLKRAIRSTWLLLQELNEVYVPVFKSWRLNERMYGALTGLSKKETAEKLGHELVQAWRGSLRSRPPPVRRSDPHWPGRQRRYSDLSSAQIPLTESLLDCMGRTEPLWENKISYELRMGRNVMVVAHANTLRGLVKIIDGIGDDEIQDVAIPTGIPIVYKFDKNLSPTPPSGDRKTASQMHMNGLFLEKPGLLKEALKREHEWASAVPGYDSTMGRFKPMTSLERSLHKLEAERELGEWAGQFIDYAALEEDDGNDGNMGKPMQLVDEDKVWDEGLHDLEEGQQFDPDFPEFHADLARSRDGRVAAEENEFETLGTSNLIAQNIPCMTAMPAASVAPGLGSVPKRKDSVIVIIRHGKTEHNKLGLFTGWEDAPLALEGIEEAKEAGRLLKAHGFEFDVVYTSWLSRAIETAWYVMDELGCLWLPIIKSWRLNERMYGGLTGLSKKMVAQKYGDAQFKAWRRGYKVRPPKVSSFSPNYPGNDRRYKEYVRDVRISVGESIIRSIERGRPELHRKLPKAESLKDCMDRTVPYFTQQIVPEAIDEGKRVLISSSENAIRGLLMHLCEIPEEKVTELEIPNGLPIIFDVKSKCVKLLDDGSGIDPLEKYNFGKAGNYLFKPCMNEDGTPDEECDISFMSNTVGGQQAAGAPATTLTQEERETIEFIKGRSGGSVPAKVET